MELDRIEAAFEKVVDERSFVDFLEQLSLDWEDERAREAIAPSNPYGPGANGWENVEFGAILECAVACWRANNVHDPVVAHFDGNIWKSAAHILWRGKYYE